MNESLFIEKVNKYFKGIILALVATLNGTKKDPTYKFLQMLRKKFSLSGKWEALSVHNTRIAADVVSMDSSLPLKKRDSIGKTNGDIPKLGMELKLNENDLTQLDTMIATGGNEAEVQRTLFQDTVRCISGVYERLEGMFLQGLSSGVTIVDTDNVGTGIRLDYGYLPANKFGVKILWPNPATAKPLDDIRRVLKKVKADGNIVTKILLDEETFEALASTEQVKQNWAFINNFSGDNANIAVPDFEQVSTLVKRNYKIILEIIDRVVKYEKNGVQKTETPWQSGMMVFVPGDLVGALVYANLAERNHPVEGVTYVLADDYILASKYRANKPALGEFTSSQARVCPVITNVDQIYQLDTKTIQA